MPPRSIDAAVPTGPFLDRATLDITPAWRAWLTVLWTRTGGSQGVATDGWRVPLAAESTARAQADTALGLSISNEAVARRNGDLNALAAVASEQLARETADGLLVPRALLCSLWAACDLSFLPTADPGHGQPWLDDNHLVVGTSSSVTVGFLLEDGSGHWLLETGGLGNNWAWG